MEKVGLVIGKIQSIIGAIAIVVVLGVVAVAFLIPKTIKDNKEFFKLTVAAKYNFKENTAVTEGESTKSLGVYDEKSGIYISGNAYEMPEKDFQELIKEDKDTYTEGATSVSEITKREISGTEAYYYSFEYVDSNEVPYYMEVNFIKTEKGLYNIDIECKTEDKDKYVKEFDKILKTFKELD